MRDIKTYLSVAPVLSTLWFGSLAGILIEINRLFPDALSFPFFSFQLLIYEEMTKIREIIPYYMTKVSNSDILFGLLGQEEGKTQKSVCNLHKNPVGRRWNFREYNINPNVNPFYILGRIPQNRSIERGYLNIEYWYGLSNRNN